jgi:hypothetical protein
LAEHAILSPCGAMIYAMPGQEQFLEAAWAELSPLDLAAAGLDAETLSPARFRR